MMCPKGKTIDDETMIGEEAGGLYKLKEQPEQELIHESIEPSELCHLRLAHVHIEHYRCQAKKSLDF